MRWGEREPRAAGGKPSAAATRNDPEYAYSARQESHTPSLIWIARASEAQAP